MNVIKEKVEQAIAQAEKTIKDSEEFVRELLNGLDKERE